MFVLKNRIAPSQPSEANSDARLSYPKQLLKTIHPLMLASLRPLAIQIYPDCAEKHTE